MKMKERRKEFLKEKLPFYLVPMVFRKALSLPWSVGGLRGTDR